MRNEDAFAVADPTEDQVMVACARHVASWWHLLPAEQTAVLALLESGCRYLRTGDPDIPLSIEFVDPGVASPSEHFRIVISPVPPSPSDSPGEALVERLLVTLHNGPQRPLGPALADALADPANLKADFLVSFVMDSGLDILEGHLERLVDRGGVARILTSDYLGVTEQSALRRLLARSQQYPEQFHARLYRTGTTSFHPKAYLLAGPSGAVRQAFVGSANLSAPGVLTGVEWSAEVTEPTDLSVIRVAFDKLWHDSKSQPLTPALVEDYQQAPRPAGARELVVAAPPTQPVAPTSLQREALDALEATRSAGYGAGLVVLATGLGKTWLAGFDAARPEFRRMLFIAHRAEILAQTRDVIRAIRPDATIGMINAQRFEPHADVVLASVATLTRRLDRIDPAGFDYVVIDEFHHAAATSYRRVVAHLQPKFLLGLTATPDRTDGADLLALCEDNLVFQRGLAEAIDEGYLVPFHYYGVPDTVDFRPLPWRNSRFDPDALEHAVVTDARIDAAFREWAAHAGTRTLGFCVSIRHAEAMASAFGNRTHPTSGRPVRAVAVHSQPTSAPRNQTLAELASGGVDIVFSVDVFSEGVDVPAIDTVLLARPTESPIVFLQQLGRGLRNSPGKSALTVIDFVGNHRSFLLPARILAGLTGGQLATDQQLRNTLQTAELDLPAGCRVDYALTAREDLIAALPAIGAGRALTEFVSVWIDLHGARPTAVQAHTAGFNPASAKPHWFAAIAEHLTEPERKVAAAADAVLAEVSGTSMTKSYKMIALRAWLDAAAAADTGTETGTGQTGTGQLGEGSILKRIPADEIAARSARMITRDPRLLADLEGRNNPDPRTAPPQAWTRYWTKWPLEHLSGDVFSLNSAGFGLTQPLTLPDLGAGVLALGGDCEVWESAAEVLVRMLQELIDWRLSSYLTRNALGRSRIPIPVKNNGDRPILLNLPRKQHPEIPVGPTTVTADGRRYEFDFVKIAVNVARPAAPSPAPSSNVLPELLRGWFGPDAGKPGTEHFVELWREGDEWRLAPMGGSAQAQEITG